MKLRYLYVDQNDQLHKISKATVQKIWEGHSRVSHLKHAPENELRLVAIICDKQLRPCKLYLLRMPLVEGELTVESKLTLQLYLDPECVTPQEAFDHHTHGWPRNFFSQLAVVMDVSRYALEVPIGIGGPLLVALAMRISPTEAMRFCK